jgi:hypothetical protein
VTANSFILSCFQVEYDDRKKKKVCHACEGKLINHCYYYCCQLQESHNFNGGLWP